MEQAIRRFMFHEDDPEEMRFQLTEDVLTGRHKVFVASSRKRKGCRRTGAMPTALMFHGLWSRNC